MKPRLLAIAGREADCQNLTLAERLGSEALGFDPQNPKVTGFVEKVRKEIEDRENERRLKVALDDARRLAAVEDFDSAIEKLESLRDVRDPPGRCAPCSTASASRRPSDCGRSASAPKSKRSAVFSRTRASPTPCRA